MSERPHLHLVKSDTVIPFRTDRQSVSASEHVLFAVIDGRLVAFHQAQRVRLAAAMIELADLVARYVADNEAATAEVQPAADALARASDKVAKLEPQDETQIPGWTGIK